MGLKIYRSLVKIEQAAKAAVSAYYPSISAEAVNLGGSANTFLLDSQIFLVIVINNVTKI